MVHRYIFLGIYLVYLGSFIACDVDTNDIKCLVCTRVIEEMQRNISKVDVNKKINVGGFRLDGDGNYLEKNVPYSKSEIYLTELMDDICTKMEDYVQATFKKDGTFTVISLMSENGLNPIMNEVDVIQDPELNKSLKLHCENILDEYDDAVVKAFKEDGEDLITGICQDVVQCSSDIIEISKIGPTSATDELIDEL